MKSAISIFNSCPKNEFGVNKNTISYTNWIVFSLHFIVLSLDFFFFAILRSQLQQSPFEMFIDFTLFPMKKTSQLVALAYPLPLWWRFHLENFTVRCDCLYHKSIDNYSQNFISLFHSARNFEEKTKKIFWWNLWIGKTKIPIEWFSKKTKIHFNKIKTKPMKMKRHNTNTNVCLCR